MLGRDVKNIIPFIVPNAIPWITRHILYQFNHPIRSGIIKTICDRFISAWIPMRIRKRHSHFCQSAIRRNLRDNRIGDCKNGLEDTRVYISLGTHFIPDHIERVFRLSDGDPGNGQNCVKVITIHPITSEGRGIVDID